VPVYERLIPDPREELMGNEWGDMMDEGNSSYPMGAAAGFGGGAVDDDIEKAILESMKQHTNHYGGGSNDIEE
jgi:hypothetical protein